MPPATPSHSCIIQRYIYVALIVLFSISDPSLSEAKNSLPAFSIHQNTSYIDLTEYIVYNFDTTSSLSIDTIIEQPKSVSFKKLHQKCINLGFNKSTLWTGFTLSNSTSLPITVMLEIPSPLIDIVNLYQLASDGSYTLHQSGELSPKTSPRPPYLYRNPTFKVFLMPMTSQTFYLSVHDKGSVPFSLKLMTSDAFDLRRLKDNALFGSYFSLITVFLLYNLIVYFIIKTKSHLFYVCYLVSLLLWQATYTGHASLFIWPQHRFLTNHAVPFFISTTAICAIFFSKKFLKTSFFVPKTNVVLNGLSLCFVATMLMSFMPDYSLSVITAAFLSIVFTLLILWTGITSWMNGYKPARYFSIAWFFLLSGTLVLALKSFGIIPSIFITEYGQYIGSLAEIFLLSLALVDMVEVLKKEKEQALQDAFAIQIEAKEKLELKVAERTVELTNANDHLADVSNKLSKYLSPQVYNSIFTGRTNATCLSTRKHLTVFFSDIAGFTDLTDSLEPEELSTILNDYLTEMSNIALKYGGTIDKFIGDSLMIF